VVAPDRPAIHSGAVTEASGDLTVAAKPAVGARLELVDPAGRSMVSGSPFKSPQAPVGTWTVTVHSAGFATERRRFVVPPDEPTLVKVELQALAGLEVTGSPAGAEVEVGGPEGFKHTGGLPWRASGLRPGKYRVQVRRSGYRTRNRTVELPPGETTQVEIELSKGGGTSRNTGKSRRTTGKQAAEQSPYLRNLAVDVGLLAGYHYYIDADQGAAGAGSLDTGLRVGVMLRNRMQLALRVDYNTVSYRSSSESFGEPSQAGSSGGHLGVGGDYAWYIGTLKSGSRLLPFFRFQFMYWPTLSREGMDDYTGTGYHLAAGLGLTLVLGRKRGLAIHASVDYGAARQTWEPKTTGEGASTISRENAGLGALAGVSYYF